MPVSLHRRIQRIGQLPSTKDENDKTIKHFVSDQEMNVLRTYIPGMHTDAKNNRTIRFDMQQKPAKEHRRSRSRRKAARETVVAKGKK